MLRRLLVLIALATITALCLSGCKKTSSETEAQQDVVKTEAEYKAEAEKEINEDNMAAELEKIERAMEQEAGQEP
ncbi:MAG: hypothetical protein ACYTBX_02625 [Planctomycetota bacterium]|jgi:uncharacterized protein YceK